MTYSGPANHPEAAPSKPHGSAAPQSKPLPTDQDFDTMDGLTRRPQRRPGWTHHLTWAVIILTLGLLITASQVFRELNKATAMNEARFIQLTEKIESDLARRVQTYGYGLTGARGLFPASKSVERHEFQNMVDSHDLARSFPGALGIGYIQRVKPDPASVATFLEATQNDGAPDFKITVPPGAEPLPGAATQDRYIIQYIVPLAVNRAAQGLDIGSHPVRREAAERAMLTGQSSITGRIGLVQDNEHVAGFLYLLPVYETGAPQATPQQRIAALRGWVYMPVLGPSLLRDLPTAADGELELAVYDGTQTHPDQLIYHTGDTPQATNQPAKSSEATTRVIEIGGRPWSIAMQKSHRFMSASIVPASVIGVAGTLISIFLAWLILVQSSATRRAWDLAEGMTQELREYAQKACAATIAKSAFLANMSHEIRTPMTAILGYADLLDDETLNSSQRENVYTIQRNGQHLVAIINDILDLSKIEAGQIEIETTAVDPTRLISEVVSLMSVRAKGKGLTLDARLTTPIPKELHIDPLRCRQIVVNLVGNALKFTELGSVCVELAYDPDAAQCSIAVHDTGIGIAPDQQDRVFEAFQQADASTTRRYGGTGLGLLISRRLAELMSGTLKLKSTPGQGSTFTLTINASTTSAIQTYPAGALSMVNLEADIASIGHDTGTPPLVQSDPTAPVTPTDSNTLPLNQVRILLAEDGPDNQRLFMFHLKKAGAHVTLAENGRLALRQLCQNENEEQPLKHPPPFDLILTDMQMPDMDGYTAVQILRDKGCTLPIVALTAHAMAGDDQRCLDVGCDAYVSKPIDRHALIRCCQTMLDKPAPHTRAA